MGKPRPAVSIVVVSYNTRSLLPACLDSIHTAADGLSYEVWVVDNASQDGTVDMLRRDYPWVRLISNTTNVGFAAANNQALERANGETLLLLNPDTEMAPRCLHLLHQALWRNPRSGAVGPRLINPDRTLQRSAHHFPTPGVLLLEQLSATALLRHISGLQRRYLGAWPHDTPRQVDWMLGACLLLRRTALETVGLLDASFFLYAEEIDLMWRLSRSGWGSWIVPEATVLHHGGASTSQSPVGSGVQWTRAMYQFYRKHYTTRRLATAQGIFRCVAVLKIIRDGVRLAARAATARPTAPIRQALTLWFRVLRLRPPAASAGAPGGMVRRLDWRYLLPLGTDARYEQLLLASGREDSDPAQLLALVKETGLAESAVSWPAGDRADCVAVLSGAGVALREAARRVSSRGVLYYEVDRLKAPHLTPGRVRRELLHAGLRVRGLYWAKPEFERCELWIPLHRPGALRYYLDSLLMATSPIRWPVRALLRRVAATPSWVPRFAVVAVRGDSRYDAPARLLGSVRLGDEPAEAAEPLLVTGGPDDRSRAVGLVFAGTSDQPCAVVKAARLAQFSDRTELEFEVLRALKAHLPSALAHSLPTPLGTGSLDDAAVLVETPVQGRCLAASCAAWGVPLARKIDDLRAATNWLTAFHRATRLTTPDWGAVTADDWLERSITRYAQRFGSTPAETRLWDVLRQRLEDCRGCGLPRVWQHRDFHAWNIFRGADGVAVIDWEAARPGLPFADLAYFGVWWYQTVHRLHDERDKLSGFRRLVSSDPTSDRATRAVRAEWDRYLEVLDIDAGFAPLLHALTWMGHALDEADRLGSSGSPDRDPRSGNIFCRYVESLAAGSATSAESA
jgi:GT2 family glycosyltransferase/aminoglycoside phosphotransferase (APT) family kinase protein